MALTLWRPTRSISPLTREVDRLFGSVLGSPFFEYQRTDLVPALDFIENEDAYLVKVELPGVLEKDITITLVDGNLEIKGEKKEETEEETELTYCSERRYGSFSRVIELPTGVDGEKTTAKYKHGILEIELPKKEEVKPKEVKIKVK
jgi:HSP20 family protein